MEWSILISPVVSAICAIFGAYMATKRASEERERKYADSIARLETKLDVLSARVEKHNSVVERMYKLETEVDNLYHRYAELKNDMHDIKIGGTE